MHSLFLEIARSDGQGVLCGERVAPARLLRISEVTFGLGFEMTIQGKVAGRNQVQRPSRGAAAFSPIENATRMLSETAHDVRAPLTSIRESVRLVRDGLLGELNDDQAFCLSAAIDQCECIDQMVGEMVQVERLRSGVPRAKRTWFLASEIRETVNETLKPWTSPRNIKVLWDISQQSGKRVFGDISMVRRLVVNLAINAIRATAEGGSLLIQVQPIRNGDAIRWSVVDQGKGIAEEELLRLSQRRESTSGGEGLGLSICRQLAALQFSSLRIESRLGTGTAVSFDMITDGPRNVAESWSKWRVGQRSPLRRPSNRDAQAIELEETAELGMQVRVDNPSVVVELHNEDVAPTAEDRISVGTIELSDASSFDTANRLDEILQTQMGMYDLVYRVDERLWVWVFDANFGDAEQRIDQLSEFVHSQIDDIGMSWSEPQSVPLDDRRTAMQLTDVFVRHSLAGKTTVVDTTDIVFEETEVIASRLDQEMQRLAERLASQNELLNQQSKRLRPNF